ncbi:virulence factor family protein [Desulfuromonas carbonis]|uniref:AcvB/VirJ family lysyl-phosphatidylglycerol hydrolase n=1 Tax=Desulfuromonas sp. DDH964 TaxID=1823759 RepID=UPI00078DD2B9|nr:AcvB/VirJ family lysyl-phosphatidylglycerol hydrolase [Desulfuromonas sp. DDH964]AMV71210.1 hypothetical protein DBW_0827 [Desulfuromonas sp. DDH964]
MSRLVLPVIVFLLYAATALGGEKTLQYGPFGTLTLYQNRPQPSHVVLFVSGDGGWNLGVVDMARSLAGLDALVVGIDVTHYLRQLAKRNQTCSYPAADFENLSKFVQKKLGFDRYRTPVLVGYSSGATLVYGLLAQAPPTTFRGAISMGFCPDLPLNKPFCVGNGLKSEPYPKAPGYQFLPATTLAVPWIAFQGASDQTCAAENVATFVKQVRGGELVLLPRVGHGFAVQQNWLPQFRDAFARLVRNEVPGSAAPPDAGSLSDLPVVELPAQGAATGLLAVLLSGDGGWASIDREVGERLAARGIAVVGLNSLQYFWTPRTPETATRDLVRLLRHYLADWNCQKVVLIGYSFGADVLPFMLARLPKDLQQRVAVVALLAPGRNASFEFHLNDWLGGKNPAELPIAPELAKLKGTKVLCLYGEEEQETLCRDLPPGDVGLQPLALGGGHHFNNDYVRLVELIFTAAQSGQ